MLAKFMSCIGYCDRSRSALRRPSVIERRAKSEWKKPATEFGREMGVEFDFVVQCFITLPQEKKDKIWNKVVKEEEECHRHKQIYQMLLIVVMVAMRRKKIKKTIPKELMSSLTLKVKEHFIRRGHFSMTMTEFEKNLGPVLWDIFDEIKDHDEPLSSRTLV